MLPTTLEEIANYIVADGKGILAADESTGTVSYTHLTLPTILLV